MSEDRRPTGSTGARSKSPADRRVRSVAIAAKLNCAVLADLFDVSDAQRLSVGKGESPKVSYLIRPLLSMGLRLHLVTLSPDAHEAFTVTGPGIALTVCPSRTSARVRDIHAFERHQIRDALASRPVDIVHAHQTYVYALGALATGLPTLITVRDWATTIARLEHGGLRSPKLAAHFATKVGMQFVTFLRGQHFTANSPYLAQRVRRVVRKPVPAIPNCLPPDVLTTTPRKLNDDVPTLLAINRGFGRLKNVTTLLQSFPFVRQRVPRARLVLVGPGYENNGSAASWASARALTDGVEFVGPLAPDAVIALLDSADLLAHPSREESFGIVLMEAMARGTPVVGGVRSGAVPWVLAGGEAGVLSDVDEPEALARSILLLLEDSQRWTQLSNAGRRHVRDRFSARAVAAQYVEAYERVVAPGQQRRPT